MSPAYVLTNRFLRLLFLLLLTFPILILGALLTRIYKCFAGDEKRKRIADEIAVVTGSGHGLGREIALELAKQGCRVAVVDINLAGAEETVKAIQNRHPVAAKAYQVDVTNYEKLEELNRQVTKDLGPVTILVNNAGVVLLSDPLNPDRHQLQRMIDVNLTSHFWTNSVFLPKMKELRRGHIVAISSLAGFIPLMYHAPYTSTKFALRGMMKAVRQELKHSGFSDIHTTTAFPTFMRTNDEVMKIVEFIDVEEIYPMIDGPEAAKSIVRSMQLNDEEVTLPNIGALLYRFLDLLPGTWQDSVMLCLVGSKMSKSHQFFNRK